MNGKYKMQDRVSKYSIVEFSAKKQIFLLKEKKIDHVVHTEKYITSIY